MSSAKVLKHILPNGLTVLILPRYGIPKVSTQLWYHVGSKDEQSGQKGIAHLIEHMIFKGTSKLSECDINLITHKLSGYCNAYTSHDYTGYLFDFPSQHWQAALPILADCMRNATFKEEFLNSELKAVIQELKMYKDDYISSLIERMISSIFPDHPYHYPIIGYKQDLWNLKRQALVDFYEYHYIPNNATLVIVGDVDTEETLDQVENAFGAIAPNWQYTRPEFYHSSDLRAESVTLYRDVQQPLVLLAWVIPGAKTGHDYVIDITSWILGSGKGSRLYKKLVDQLQLVTELETFSYDLFDAGIFFIHVQPKRLEDMPQIIGIINAEIEDIRHNGPTQAEIDRAIKKTEVDYLALLENNQKQAYGIGKYYLATGDEQYLLTYTEYPKQNLGAEIKELLGTYLRPSLMYQGKVLSIATGDKPYWALLQELSDAEDARILAGRTRVESVEEGRCVVDIGVEQPKDFEFPQAQVLELSNGLRVLYCQNSLLPKIDLIVDFKAKSYYDPEHAQGLANFVSEMLTEGSEKYTANQFADTLESYGMTLQAYPGQVALSMLSSDFTTGLELLVQAVAHATFEHTAVEKVRAQLISDLKYYWDNPAQFAGQLMRQEVYPKDHPYHKAPLGTEASIGCITRQELLDFYHQYITPQCSRLVIIGDLTGYNLPELLEKYIGSWQGPHVPSLEYPELHQLHAQEINYPIARDQVMLCYAGLSVNRQHPDYDKLLLFDQVFSGGLLGSMSSRLFDLRERTGLFYTISGSLLSKVTKQPGMISIKTLVSLDRLEEADRAIKHVVNTAVDTLTQDELDQARQAVINSLVDNFASNYHTASTLLLKDIYQFPDDYFDTRPEQLRAITVAQVQEVVRRWLSADKLVTLRIGRVN